MWLLIVFYMSLSLDSSVSAVRYEPFRSETACRAKITELYPLLKQQINDDEAEAVPIVLCVAIGGGS